MSQLPPLLLERLKRRGIIKRVGEDAQKDQTRPKSSQTPGLQASTLKSAESFDPNHEEIIAEDYSDSSNDDEPVVECDTNARADPREQDDFSCETRGDDPPESNVGGVIAEGGELEDQLQGESVLGCPNKYNIYHECSEYCLEHYSNPDSMLPTLEQRKQLALVLRSYPLPNEWQVVYDPGVKTFYFWNIVSDLVSWLPPVMNGFVSKSATEIRKFMKSSVE